MEDKIEEGIIIGAKESAPIKETELKNKEDCICKIDGNKIGTGFFFLLKYKEKYIKLLITNYHVINDEYLKDKNKLKVYINEEYKIIKINNYLEIDENIFKSNSELSYNNEQIYIYYIILMQEKVKYLMEKE